MSSTRYHDAHIKLFSQSSSEETEGDCYSPTACSDCNLSGTLHNHVLKGMLGTKRLGLVVDSPSGDVAKVNTP
jgi:hypothetical protein